MKKLLLIGSFLVLITTLKAQTTISLGDGLDCSPEYSNVDYWIEGTMTFHERSDGTKYLSYDIIFNVYYDPIMLAHEGTGVEVFGNVYVNNQSVTLNFPNYGRSTSGFENGEIGLYMYGETELDSNVTYNDIGFGYIYADYVLRTYEMIFNW